MLTEDDRDKFKATCAMMVFVHYAMDHPLYTYAFFSPRTKRVVFRQDCIFLLETFPMCEARTRVGLIPDGEILVTYRPRNGQDSGKEEGISFGQWKDEDPLPFYQDHITGFPILSPSDGTSDTTPEKPSTWPRYRPSHSSFGPPSVVEIPVPWGVREEGRLTLDAQCDGDQLTTRKDPRHDEQVDHDTDSVSGENKPCMDRPRRTRGIPHRRDNTLVQPLKTRRPVKERWFYEPVLLSGAPIPHSKASKTALLSSKSPKNEGQGGGERDGEGDKDQKWTKSQK
jgi:hypothetical protein